jgi:hypothetical protein
MNDRVQGPINARLTWMNEKFSDGETTPHCRRISRINKAFDDPISSIC